MVKEIFSPKPLINVRGELWDLSSPKVMGIANITPDSFYPGSRVGYDNLIVYVSKMIDEGVDLVDLGGYSSRPGADDISEQEEMDRVLPAVEKLIKEFNLVISIDTFRSKVALEAINGGASMVNDISGGDMDPAMWETVKGLDVPYIMMHMRGNPKNMHLKTDYKDVTLSVIDDLQKKINALERLGIKDIIVDPGFGFSKSLDQNYELLNNLDYFKVLERPFLLGVSRKSMIFKELGISPQDALNGTSVLNTIGILKGASILRVHDVKEAKEAVRLTSKLNKKEKTL
ncbi:MAG: dihydropteroate synthase [Flavobacteriaceae bacterium]|nr:dihydropteroate synthase [Flavobacteriaceae bacterium]